MKTPAAMTVSMLSMAITRFGAILPSINSSGRIGVTSNCSIVPASRSRTTASAVRVTAEVCNNSAVMLGTTNHSCA